MFVSTVSNSLFLFQSNILQKYKKLQANITRLLTQSDCKQLGDYFNFTKEQVEAIQNSDSSSEVFEAILEESGAIHPGDVSKLLEALRVLNINDIALRVLEEYTVYKGELISVKKDMERQNEFLLFRIGREFIPKYALFQIKLIAFAFNFRPKSLFFARKLNC